MIKILLLISSLVTILFADTVEDDFIKDLQDDLETYSQIATDTKQNVDYMPYIVSVLKHDELSSLGVLSLGEALSLVPGVDMSIGMVGVKNPIFRGSNPFAVGQSKLIIDGVVVNDQMFGAYNQYLDMPVDIIHRIEIVRGPGSLQNDVNAYAGSIHVITRANRDDGDEKENVLFTSFGSDNYRMGGFISSYEDGEVEINSDLFYQEHDKSTASGPDRFGTVLDAQQWLEHYALGLSVTYKGLYLKGHFNKNTAGVSTGQAFSLSEDSSDSVDAENSILKFGYKFNIDAGVEAELSFGSLYERRELQNKVMPDGASIIIQNTIPVIFPKGYYSVFDYAEQTYDEALDIKISSIKNHNVSFGIKLSQSYLENNIASHSTDGLKSFFQVVDILSNDSRKHTSLYVDDLINIDEKTSIQLGLKFDRYNDVDDQFSPRFAIVHRYDEDNIYKFMYTHSYREPSWREQYLSGTHYFSADPNVEEEKVEAYEASYIRKFGIDSDIKVNLFYLENRGQIHSQNASNTFTNDGNHELHGLELELKTSLSDKDQIYMNYSYVDGSNVADTLANSSKNIAKAYYIYNIKDNINISSIIKYVGDKERTEEDTRDKVDDYLTVDFTLGYLYKRYDLKMTASVKNLFDENYYLPAPEGTYDDDFLQDGRSFLFRLSKRF